MSLRAFAQGFAQTATPGIQMAFQRIGERKETKRKEERQEELLGEQREYQKGVRGEEREYQKGVLLADQEREDLLRSDNNIREELQTARTPEAVDKIWGTLTTEQQSSLGTMYEAAKGNSVRFQGMDERKAKVEEQQLAQGEAVKRDREAKETAQQELYTGTGLIKTAQGQQMARAAWTDAKNSGDTEVAGRLAGRLGPEFVKETTKYFKRANDASTSQLMLTNPERFTRGQRLKHALQAEPGTGGNAVAAQARSEGVLSERTRRESILHMVTEQEFAARADAQKYNEERVPKTQEQLMGEVREHFKTFQTIELDGDVESAINTAWASNASARGGATVAREVVEGTMRIMQERGRVKLTPPVRAMIEKKVLELMEPPKDETATPEAGKEEQGFFDSLMEKKTPSERRGGAMESAGNLALDLSRVAGVQGQAMRNIVFGPSSEKSSGLRKAIDGDGSTYQDPWMTRALTK